MSATSPGARPRRQAGLGIGPEPRRLGSGGKPGQHRGLGFGGLGQGGAHQAGAGLVGVRAAPELVEALKCLLTYANAYSDKMRERGFGAEELGEGKDPYGCGAMAEAALLKAGVK